MKYKPLVLFATVAMLLSCKEQNPTPKTYNSEILKVEQITSNTFIHISYLETEDYGKVAANGMIFIDNGEAMIFDTPTNDKASKELIGWIEQKLECKVRAVVATHFHNDCLGGIAAFNEEGILSIANDLTIALAKMDSVEVPKTGFKNKSEFSIGNVKVINQFFGEGHTKDNIVCYIPSEKVLFGGCLIKSVGAGKGYLGDANVGEWSNTVLKIKKTFPNVKHVVPGHGKAGGIALLDYTIEKFKDGQ